MPSKSKRTRPSPSRVAPKKTPASSRPKPKPKVAVSTRTTKPSSLSQTKRPSPARKPAVRSRREVPKRAPVLRSVPKPPLPKPRPPLPAATVSADAASIQSALDFLARAQAEMTARGVDLLAVAHDLGRNAAQALKTSLVDSLVEDQLLSDLKRLHHHLGSAAGTPSEFQLLAEATLNWFARHFDLTEHLEAGQFLEILASQLEQYDFDGPHPDADRAFVQVQVLAPGWKCRSQIIIPPRVALVVPLTNSTTKAPEPTPPNNPS